MAGRRPILVVLDPNFWPAIRVASQRIPAAVETSSPGTQVTVNIPKLPPRRRAI